MPRTRIEIFTPPNILKAKVGGTVVGLDSAAIARAEAAVEELANEYPDWVKADVETLVRANNDYKRTRSETAARELLRSALDLKSQGAHFGYPMIGRVAVSLCDLLELIEIAPGSLIDAHVNSISALFRNHQDGPSDTALLLISELERQTAEICDAA